MKPSEYIHHRVICAKLITVHELVTHFPSLVLIIMTETRLIFHYIQSHIYIQKHTNVYININACSTRINVRYKSCFDNEIHPPILVQYRIQSILLKVTNESRGLFGLIKFTFYLWRRSTVHTYTLRLWLNTCLKF